MGATLVAEVIQNWSHVSDRAFRVLVAMAVTAKDNASKDVGAGLYFGGQEHLAHALARTRVGSTDTAIRTVKRAIQELTKAGAIRCTQPAVLGSNAVYKLTLNTIPMPVDNSSSGSTYFHNRRDTPSPPSGDTPSPPSGDTPSPNGGTLQVPPSKEPLEEPKKELEKEEEVALRADLTVVAPHADANEPEEVPPRCRNPECLIGLVIDKTRPKGNRSVRCPQCNGAVQARANIRKAA